MDPYLISFLHTYLPYELVEIIDGYVLDYYREIARSHVLKAISLIYEVFPDSEIYHCVELDGGQKWMAYESSPGCNICPTCGDYLRNWIFKNIKPKRSYVNIQRSHNDKCQKS
nr:hypothetical protein K-LCC10_0295 [Kaumoebavirus]